MIFGNLFIKEKVEEKNGNLINASLLRDEYEAYGSIFKTTSDTEVIIHLLAKPTHVSKPDPLAHVLKHLQGAYSLLFLFSDRIEAARDPYGIKPLCIGQTKKGAYVVASETCAFDAIDAKFVREVEPGEIVTLNKVIGICLIYRADLTIYFLKNTDHAITNYILNIEFNHYF